jgi:basic membrane lipoprotein Med (substrate-binding protein (PBP1-ABC) superfamily)
MPSSGFPLRRTKILAIACAATAVLGALTIWPVLAPSQSSPRAREYLAATNACLLTDNQGTASQHAAPVWRGMQKASLKTRAKIQFLATYGPSTTANAIPYVNTLAQRKCSVILAAGKAPTDAVIKSVQNFPHTTFVIVGGSSARHGNLVVVNNAQNQVATAVENAVEGVVG